MSATGKAGEERKIHRLIYVIILLKSFRLSLNDYTSQSAINREFNLLSFYLLNEKFILHCWLNCIRIHKPRTTHALIKHEIFCHYKRSSESNKTNEIPHSTKFDAKHLSTFYVLFARLKGRSRHESLFEQFAPHTHSQAIPHLYQFF